MAKVLIVDDSEFTRAMIRDILVEMGHEVAGEAQDVPQALEKLKTLTPDLITLDIVMPGGSGVDILRRIKKDNQAARVVVITASGQDVVGKEVMELGAAAVMRKPFTTEEFKAIFQNVMGKQLSPADEAQFRKLIESGVQGSVNALAKLTKRQWELVSVGVQSKSTTDFIADFEKDKYTHAGVRLSAGGQYPMLFLLMFSGESSEALTDAMRKAYKLSLGDLSQSRKKYLEEIGNIMVGALINDSANNLQQAIPITAPAYMEGSKRDFMNIALDFLGSNITSVSRAIMVSIDMRSEELSAECELMILASQECLKDFVDRAAGTQ